MITVYTLSVTADLPTKSFPKELSVKLLRMCGLLLTITAAKHRMFYNLQEDAGH